MRWPFVSALAYDLLVSERDTLRAQVAKLQDDVVRLSRVSNGMREVPKPPVDPLKQKPPEVPYEVKRLYAGRCQSQAMEIEIERQAVEVHQAGTPWSEVARLLELQLGPPPEGAQA